MNRKTFTWFSTAGAGVYLLLLFVYMKEKGKPKERTNGVSKRMPPRHHPNGRDCKRRDSAKLCGFGFEDSAYTSGVYAQPHRLARIRRPQDLEPVRKPPRQGAMHAPNSGWVRRQPNDPTTCNIVQSAPPRLPERLQAFLAVTCSPALSNAPARAQRASEGLWRGMGERLGTRPARYLACATWGPLPVSLGRFRHLPRLAMAVPSCVDLPRSPAWRGLAETAR